MLVARKKLCEIDLYYYYKVELSEMGHVLILSRSTVIIALSCIVSEIKGDLDNLRCIKLRVYRLCYYNGSKDSRYCNIQGGPKSKPLHGFFKSCTKIHPSIIYFSKANCSWI